MPGFKRSSLIVALLILASAGFNQQSQAQQVDRRQMRPAQAPQAWGAPKPNQANNGTIVELKKPVDLPNLPTYTGHSQFTNGIVQEHELGTTWTQYFAVKEETKDVVDWYSQVLGMQQWQIQAQNSTQDGSRQMMAKSKDGNTCTLNIRRNIPATKGNRTTLVIGYFIPAKKH